MSEKTMLRGDLLKQVPRNALANILSFFLHVVIGIWFVPYLIRHVGIAAYGLIPLAASMTNYAGLVTVSISGSVGRFLTIDIQSENKESANRTLNTAFWALFLVCLCLLVAIAAFSFHVERFFTIPQGIEQESRWLFFSILSAFLLTTLAGPLGAIAYSYNRLDLTNCVNMAGTLIRTVLVIFFFYFLGANLFWAGFGYFFGASFILWGYYNNGKGLASFLHLAPKYFDRPRLGQMGTMGGWILINQVGSLLFLQVELILANKLLGAAPAGEYAAVLQWSTLIRSMAGIVSGVLSPLVMISYARNDFEGVEGIAKKAVFFMGIGIAFPIGLLCGLAPNILSIWIGSEFAGLAPLMVLMLGHLVINLAVLPLFIINVAYNQVRVPGLVTLFMGIANIGLSLFFVLFGNLGMYGIALAGAIMLTLKNAFFTPWYASAIMGKKYSFFLMPMTKSVAAATGLGLSAFALRHLVHIKSWTGLFLVSSLFFIIYVPVVWYLLTNSDEKNFLLSMVPEKMRKLSTKLRG
ncbi:putative membrane protein EpsK [bioreactor metagenome]|uniref:Putative membrane protein EpsK n=1 Tax=bioreactor metagenome TaxID=1076179 RepID=A0A644XKK0_9ZZZZ